MTIVMKINENSDQDKCSKKSPNTMTKEFSFDIVIVGAGPAGSSAAYSAAKNGAKVAILEKENTKLCIRNTLLQL